MEFADVPPDHPAHAGQAAYSAATLRLYDAFVLGFSNRLAWHCPASKVRRLYDESAADVHLEVGPGSGYFLDHCTFPTSTPELVLADLNPTCLRYTARRVARYRPQLLQADVLQPLPLPAGRFGSIGLTYVLHCLPGAMKDKAAVLAHLAPLLRPGGVLFGATIVPAGGGLLARTLTGTYNRKGIFSNLGDDLESLQSALDTALARPETEVQGNVILFRGWAP